ASTPAQAQVVWPKAQLLPSFPAPAAQIDLIQLHSREQHWEAETLGHATGRLETDGWLCQVGIDTPNQHMVYGPYDKTIPGRPNTAVFRIKIDDNTADDAPIVSIDVNDSTTAQVLASQIITRKKFTAAGQYVTFPLPFVLPADEHAVELRVYWYGGAYTK